VLELQTTPEGHARHEARMAKVRDWLSPAPRLNAAVRNIGSRAARTRHEVCLTVPGASPVASFPLANYGCGIARGRVARIPRASAPRLRVSSSCLTHIHDVLREHATHGRATRVRSSIYTGERRRHILHSTRMVDTGGHDPIEPRGTFRRRKWLRRVKEPQVSHNVPP